MTDVLSFCGVVLTMLMVLGVAVWLCCSIVESIIKLRRRLKNSRYDTLLKNNERLKSLLADVEEENACLKSVYYFDRIHRKSNVRRNVA